MAQEYARSIARTAVAQLAGHAGYERVQVGAHEVLADLLMRYLAELSSSAHSYAELAGRTATNISDVLLALEDMGVKAEDLLMYSQVEDDIPFAHQVAKFPVKKRPKLPPSFAAKKEEPPKHIPDFLPAFPDKHTYLATPAYAAHDKDARKQRLAADAAKRQAEEALTKLHARQTAPVAAPDRADWSGGADSGQRPVMERDEAGVNPFLRRPLWEEQPRPAQDADKALNTADAAKAGSLLNAEAEQSAVPAVDWKGEWQESALPEDTPVLPSAAPVVPFSLDYAARLRAQASVSASHLPFEDAFAAQKEPSPEPTAAGRKRKLNAKGRSRYVDPSASRADYILERGGQSLEEDE